jgi:sulfite reductase (NADPH) flavoprotein alpha-component
MWRRVHSAFGLAALVVILSLAISGAILSVYPVAGSLSSLPVGHDRTVGDIAGPLAAAEPGMQSIEVRPSGQIIANYSDASGAPQSGIVDPATGKISGPLDTGSAFYGWLKDFHRAFLLGDKGRVAAGVGAAALAVLSLSGLALLVSRMGGWARLFDRPKGRFAARLHTVLTRLALLPFLLSSLTAVYLTLAQFNLITVQNAASLAYPESAQGLPAVSPGTLAGLTAVPLRDLRALQFPMTGDALDVFTLRTAQGLTVVDQFTGGVLETVPATGSQKVYAWVYALHTGEGLAWLGALLGLAAAMVPAIAVAGVAIWWQRRRAGPTRVPGNIPASKAQVVVLVGSEGGSTWGFARALHRGLTSAGKSVHLDALNGFSGHYPMAEQVLFLTSTYGDGHAPESASKAFSGLNRQVHIPKWRYGVLGFGDRAFPKFCQFAKDLDGAMADRGWPALLPATLINRQSTQAFASWGNELGQALGIPLTLTHQIATPPTLKLTLIDRQVHGRDLQAPTAILRFRLSVPPRHPGRRRIQRWLGVGAAFAPTDLLGVVPPDDAVPRYYSVASTASDTEVEICVRKQIGGRCSTLLHDLEIGDEIDAFAIANPDFSLPSRRKPVIMVSAGTGIAPFAGLIRDNHRQQPLHLFWGGRAPTSDFLYEDTLQNAVASHHLSTLTTAFSRVENGAYVQDRVRADAARLAQLLKNGAAIMVCGGDAMAHAVRAEFEAILQTIGSSVEALKKRGLYLEDVF